MLFNSLQFAFFLPAVMVALFFLTPRRARWVLLLAASYYFYLCWKPAYAVLIIASPLIDSACAVELDSARGQVKSNVIISNASVYVYKTIASPGLTAVDAG